MKDTYITYILLIVAVLAITYVVSLKTKEGMENRQNLVFVNKEGAYDLGNYGRPLQFFSKKPSDGSYGMLEQGAQGGLLPGTENQSILPGITSNAAALAAAEAAASAAEASRAEIEKAKKEAEEIRKIVTAFKFNMLPEFKGGSNMGRQLTVPNTFDIEYMYNGEHNSYIHKISTCFLENMSVTYGGDRYTTHAYDGKSGAPPTETTMTLNFKEIETMTRERIFEGY